MLKLCPIKLPFPGEGLQNESIFLAVHEISRNVEPPYRVGVGQILFGSNDSRINPHMRAKFGRSQTPSLRLPGFTRDICIVIAQDNCILDIFSKLDAEIVSPKTLPPGWMVR